MVNFWRQEGCGAELLNGRQKEAAGLQKNHAERRCAKGPSFECSLARVNGWSSEGDKLVIAT